MNVTTPRPGSGLLHPLALAAAALLATNDHLLKPAFSSWWTGKLSDVAGLALFPFFLVALVEVIAAARGRYRGPSRRVLLAAVAFTAAAFALVKTVPAMADAYRVGLGALQWPFRGSYAPVTLARDATDLLALPAALVALVATRPSSRGLEKLALAVTAALCVATSPASDTWLVLGAANGPRVTVTDLSQPERFLVVYTIARTALPPSGDGLFDTNVTATLKTFGTARVELELTDPARPTVGSSAVQVGVGEPQVSVSARGIPVGDLRCDATSCTVRAEVRIAGDQLEIDWSVSALVHAEVDGSDRPPPGAAIQIAIMALE